MNKCSIVIPTMTMELTKRCLDSIVKYTDGDRIELVIVANGMKCTKEQCIDDLRQYADYFNGFKIFWYDHPLGAVKALNIGITESSGDYIMLMNDDCAILESPKNYWFDELFKPFDEDPLMGITGPFRMMPILGSSDLHFNVEKFKYGFILFFCAIIPRWLIEKIGLLDETLLCGVDVDFCMKVMNLGYKITQVPEEILDDRGKWALGTFPFFHDGEATVHDFYKEKWVDILKKDAEKLNLRYGVDNKIHTTILIPAYGDCFNDLSKCILSIYKNTNLENVEILVISNGCNNNVNKWLLKNNNIRSIIYKEALGATKAINIGFKEANGEFIALLNQDVVITGSKWLDMLLLPFNNSKVGITGPLKVPIENIDKEFIMFFCSGIRKSMINEIGLLDESFNPGGFEDMDYAMRAYDNGWELKRTPDDSPQYGKKYGFEGGFPIFHEEHHNDWMKSEIFDKNIKHFYDKHFNHIMKFERKNIEITWPLAQKKYEIMMFQEFLKNYRIEKVLEIGTYRGGTAMLWAHIVEPIGGHVYCSDLNFDWGDFVDFGYADPSNKKYRRQVYNDTPYEKYITEFKGNSQDLNFVKHVKENVGIVDFLFIDGDHSYEGVRNDFINFYSTVKTGGYIMFHDIVDSKHHRENGCYVNRFWNKVKEVLPNWEFIDQNTYPGCPHHSMGLGLIQKISDEIPEKFFEIKKLEEKISMEIKNVDVTAYISTKDRYNTTLPLAIAGIISQNVKPKEFVLIDDGDQIDLRTIPVYDALFKMLEQNNISWRVLFGKRIGQVANHQMMLSEAKYDIIWRVDDDNYIESNVLESLLSKLLSDNKIGAVGSRSAIPGQKYLKSECSSKIEDLYTKPNLQWSSFEGSEEVDHLHNTFLFRKEAAKHGYHMGLSPVGHREETMFTYGMKLAGWKLYVLGYIISWHLRQPAGGIRFFNDPKMWESDEEKFKIWMKENNKQSDDNFIAVLDSGLGDHLDFLKILPDIKKKYSNITLATCYPDVFKDENVIQISIEDAKNRLGNIDQYNIYRFMALNNWDKSIVEAYRKLYNV